MRLAFVALLCLCAVGCSSTCKDGTGFLIWERGEYKACGQECHTEGKECRCSSTCPCWKKHG